MSDYTVRKIDDMDAAFGGGFKRARAELGVTAFGFQVIDLPPGFDRYPDHDHADQGQEEVFVTLRGSGTLAVEGDEVPLDADTMVRVGPAVRRKVVPGDEGLRMLVIGGVPGAPYVPGPASEIGGQAPPLGTPR